MLNNVLNGKILSIKLSRKKLSNASMVEIIKIAKAIAKNNLLIEVSGENNDKKNNYNQTLQTISIADIIYKELNSKIPKSKRIPVLLSGGTNSSTPEFAKKCSVPFNGITQTPLILSLKNFKNHDISSFENNEILNRYII